MVRSLIAVILLTVLAVGDVFAQSQEALSYVDEKDVSFNSAQARVFAKAKQEKALASYQLVRFNNLGSLKGQTKFKMSLPGKTSLTAERKWFKTKKTNEWTMSGTLGDSGSVFLSVTDEDVYGVIQIENELYWLRTLGNGLHILIKVDPKKIPRDEPEDWNPISPDTNKTEQSKTEDQTQSGKNGLAKSTYDYPIEVLVVYTPAVAAHNGNISSFVNACVGSTVNSLGISNMAEQIDLVVVGAVQVNYTESGYVGTDKDRLITSNDGYMDNIFTLRDQYGADVVVLLVDYDSYGYAGIAADIRASSAYAYCVVVDDYAVGNYTFSHEIGHLIGARHDNDPASSPEAYAHGYRYNPGNWRTIMAVYDPVVVRINYWSSPLNTYGGVAMGTSNWNDDRRVWLERAITVKDFRQSYIYPTVSITGPSAIYHPITKGQYNTYTWTANINGGSSPFTYQWTHNSSVVGTGSTYSMTLGYAGEGGDPIQWTLGLTVTDGINNSANATKLITEGYEMSKRGAPLKQVPEEFSLYQNNPNPFNPATTISYDLPEDGFVSLKIYNTLGNEIATLMNDYKTAGSYSVNWDASNLSSGLYFYRMQAGKFSATKKMLLTK